MGELPSSSRRILDAWPQLDQLQTDRLQNAVEIVKHFVVGEVEKDETLRRERGGARCVVGKLFAGRMGDAVHLDDEPCVEWGEVGDVAAERDLSAKAEASDLFSPKPLPEASLSAGGVPSQASRK